MRPLARLFGLSLLLISAGAVHSQTPDPAELDRVWTKCSACHSHDASKHEGIGPNLGGLAGRRAGHLTGFQYSPAFHAVNFVWSDATLNAFIENPQAVVPGTVMAFSGLRNARDRALLVCLLLNGCDHIPAPSSTEAPGP